ncbi:MarR family winged helix-turn-helix transcriptional regulator [Methanobacterium paludis]|uniref:Transcriptional regulator, MarR family n=1 Tax=Methanobacterium paludis (strain DSM 25820 / JCM 18151 / SWAN1) TaxID=868131 RepID=F6D7T8_METPW|nr:MarR family transcriptional regulator [Methanobacterium paludis]AEG17776.1 transcriptional regulator, MarR family [Methanobacterium paludis]
MNDNDIELIMVLLDEIGDKLMKTNKENILKLYENLTITEANTIYAIGTDEPKTMKQIAKTLGVATSTPTRTVDRLLEKGLVKRTVGEKDRRQVLIELTFRCKKLMEDMDKEGLKMTKKLLQNFSDEEIESFKNILLRVNKNINKIP